MKHLKGFPIFVPNDVIKGNGFYISYNNRDTYIYGSDTTALVIGQMEKFFILNGNHVKEYKSLINKGLKECTTYFISNLHLKNKYSDHERGCP